MAAWSMRTDGQRWLRRIERRGVLGAAVVWTVPVVVIALTYFSPRHIASPQTVLTGLLALGILALAVRRPDLSLLGLIIFLPFQGLLLAKLWSWGMPDSVVRHLGAWKECLALGVIVAGARNLIASKHRLDLIDGLALGFVGICLLYAGFQATIVPGAPSPSNIRLLGFREMAGFVLLLFGARHAPLGPGFARRAARTVFLVGVAVAAVGVYSAIFSSAWNRFVVHTIKYTQYQAAILHTNAPNPADIRVYGYVGGAKIVRIGSVFLDSLSCAWFLILPFAVGLERVVRRTASPLILLGTILVAACLLLTQTRSAILGGLVVAVLAVAPAAGRPRHWRTQVAIVLTAVAALGIPAAFATGLAKRVESAGNQSNQDTAGHLSGFWSGINTLGAHPLGLGLGTGAGTGQRFQVRNDRIPENNYLEVGDELGIFPGLLFVLLTVGLLVRLRRVSRQRPELLVTAAWTAGAGLALAAWFLQTWSNFAVAWTYWALAGAALRIAHQTVAAPVLSGRRARAPGYDVAGRALPSASR
jgi:hypothetical protein